MYEVYELVGINSRRTITTADSFDAAKAAVVAMGVEFIDDDADHPGCADAYLTCGIVVAIQPVGFKAG